MAGLWGGRNGVSWGKLLGRGSVLNSAFKEEEDSDRLRRVRECFVNGILSHAQELGGFRNS